VGIRTPRHRTLRHLFGNLATTEYRLVAICPAKQGECLIEDRTMGPDGLVALARIAKPARARFDGAG
jgi:hypothetical protein